MKKYFLFSACIIGLASTCLYGQAQSVQNKDQDQYDEVIIRRKGDLPEKMTIDLNGKEVLINGKKPEDVEGGGDIEVTRKKYSGNDDEAFHLRQFGPSFPRRNFSFTSPQSNNRALLGVITRADSGEAGGAAIREVEKGTPADSAGLQEGDVITRVDDNQIGGPEDLSEAIGKYNPGDQISLTYNRKSKENSTTIILGKNDNRTNGMGMMRMPMDRNHFPGMMPGLTPGRIPRGNFNFQSDNPRASNGSRLGMTIENRDDDKGVTIVRVEPGSLADQSGFQPDDVLTTVAGKKVHGVEDVKAVLQHNKKSKSVSAAVIRDGKTKSLTATLPVTHEQANL